MSCLVDLSHELDKLDDPSCGHDFSGIKIQPSPPLQKKKVIDYIIVLVFFWWWGEGEELNDFLGGGG